MSATACHSRSIEMVSETVPFDPTEQLEASTAQAILIADAFTTGNVDLLKQVLGTNTWARRRRIGNTLKVSAQCPQ